MTIIVPIFLLIGLGYGCGRAGLFGQPQVQGLARFVLYVALPALIFQTLAGRRLQEILQPIYLLTYALGCLLSFGLSFFWFRPRVGEAGAAIFGLGTSMSNSGFIGAPLALQFFGNAAGAPIALTFVTENAILLPLALALAHVEPENGGRGRLRATLRSLTRSPLLIAVLLGALFALLAVPLPAILTRAIALLAGASAPAALFAIGAGLVGVRLRGQLDRIGLLAAAKLVLHPLSMTLFVLLMPLHDPLLRTVAIFLAAVPMPSIYPLLAARVGQEEVAGPALLVSTIGSFFTLTLVAWLLTGGHA